MRKHFLFCFQMQQLQLLGEISVREITQPFRKINTSVEFDENCLECVKIKQEKENENT